MRVALGLVTALAWIGVAAAGTPTAPKLRASVPSSGTARVAWTARSVAGKDGTALELERAGATGAFAPVTSVSAPKRRGTVDDSPTAAGTYSYRARVLTGDGTSDWSAAVTVQLAGAAVAPPAGPAGDPPMPAGLTECPAGWTDTVLQIVNTTRRGVGLSALVNNAKLAKAARIRTIDQARAQVLSHTGWATTIRAAGYTGGFLAENIAYGYKTPDAVMTGWIKSSGHYANIVGNYRDSGVGCAIDSRGRPWWTQDFGF